MVAIQPGDSSEHNGELLRQVYYPTCVFASHYVNARGGGVGAIVHLLEAVHVVELDFPIGEPRDALLVQSVLGAVQGDHICTHRTMRGEGEQTE